jgi:hypothetical protein
VPHPPSNLSATFVQARARWINTQPRRKSTRLARAGRLRASDMASMKKSSRLIKRAFQGYGAVRLIFNATGVACWLMLLNRIERPLRAFADHGEVGETLASDGGDSEVVLAYFAKAGIDVHALGPGSRTRGRFPSSTLGTI